MTSSSAFRLLSTGNVEEVAAKAWQNVSAHSAEYAPLSLLAGLADLQALPDDQLGYRAKVQFLLSDEVRAFVRAAEKILSRLVQTTRSRLNEGRVPNGAIDWPATVLRRLGAYSDPSIFMLRQSEVHRDVPENRLFKFLLNDIQLLCQQVIKPQPSGGWQATIGSRLSTIERLARHPVLRDFPAELTRQGYLSARASRTVGYRDVARVYELYDGLFRRGDQSLLLDLFRRSVLIPEEEDRAFELLVLFRVLDHLEALGARRSSIRLIGRGSGPIFTFNLGDCQIDVHYQNVPSVLRNRSLYRAFTKLTSLGASLLRPDILLRVSKAGVVVRTVLLEVKCSENLDTIRDGLAQLLSYFADFRLHQEQDVVLGLVAYGNVPQHESWPRPIHVGSFWGHLTDLAGLSSALAAIALCQ